QNNFSVYPLPYGIDTEKDAELTGRVIEEETGHTDFLIIDHYGLDLSWEEYIRPYTEKIMVIDDFVNRRHACDILLNQNYGVEALMYNDLVPLKCRKLTGSSYVLLRNQFRDMRKKISPRNGEIKKIFIFFGGADPTNETKKAIEAVRLLDNPNVSCIILVGNSNPYRKEIESVCALLPKTVFCRQVYDVADLMAEADLAIGAGGSNTWERCCLGLPSMMIILAENQRLVVEKLATDGIAVNAGWYEDVTSLSLVKILKELFTDPKKLLDLSDKAFEIVDGKGASRVAKEMLQ
ncbi:MAG: UDP-2,4-diacetamido-2,4,6-trideoxy-beta-L-altropyranose hydrolase, partial [Proteobacteria bacterium]|nr:UDP-2,4-diacetamido-2,4,6-trideoxy-beta-L-altropyranose hydrolase [Pseudomonadota bacterium]